MNPTENDSQERLAKEGLQHENEEREKLTEAYVQAA
jgi:hypothetical protein